MRTQLTICTEADYLQAHLTVIEGDVPVRKTTWRDVKLRIRSIVKRWIFSANSSIASRYLFSVRA
jgi:hypothetical protein